MRALISGGTGFVGSHLVRRLVGDGWDVSILVRRESDTWRIKDVLRDVAVVYGDLRKLSDCEEKIKSLKPEALFHLAWHGAGSNKDANNIGQVFDNIDGSLKLVKACGETGCSCMVGLGSVLEYGNYSIPVKEDGIATPKTLYGTAKYATGVIAERLCAQYDMRFSWLRLFWSYGPADIETRMIPYVITRLLKGETPSLTEGRQKWDYIYIDDAVNAVISAAENQKANGFFNLGSGQAYTVRHVAEKARDLINPNLKLGLGKIPYAPGQIMHLEADINSLRTATGWSPKVELADGLASTISWYKKHMVRS
ncbi:MAG: NAD-dependent epimerase/dehydratase family protein [Candidatus Altiarchaeota archaeon]